MNLQQKKNFKSIIFSILIFSIFILSLIFFINTQPETSIYSRAEISKLVESNLQSLTKKISEIQKEITYFMIEIKITKLQTKIAEFRKRVCELTGEAFPLCKKEVEEKEEITAEEISATTETATATTTEGVATTTIETSTTTQATTTEEDSVVYSGGGGGSSVPQPEVDTSAPATIANLSASNPTFSSIDISWTAPGDDSNSGTASSYDIRYSTTPITSQNWDSASQITGEPSPASVGSSQSMTISGLSYGVTYYFVIKTSDEVPNVSEISNVANLTTNIPEECPAPLTSGKQIYFVRTQNQPQIMQVDVDPLDVKIEQIQTVTVKIRDINDNPITSVAGLAEIDNGSISFSLSLISGTDIDGTWEGTWTLKNTNCLNFMMTINTTSASGQSTVDLAFR